MKFPMYFLAFIFLITGNIGLAIFFFILGWLFAE